MNCLMIAAIEYNEFEGISKKIISQAKALSHDGSCSLLCLGREGVQIVTFFNCEFAEAKTLSGFTKEKRGIGDRYLVNDLVKAANKMAAAGMHLVYIRHMLPSFALVRLLSKFRKNKTRIIYEIPTYPYFYEQMLVSKNKLKTIVKLCIEAVFWPIIYQKVNKICVIRCKTNAKMWKKMVSIPNGYDGQIIENRTYKLNSINMIGVGTIYPYHGYDIVIDAMEKSGCKTVDGVPVYFTIVGESETIDDLKRTVALKKLEQNVFFPGPAKGEKLKDLYMASNLGIGTLRLSMRGADVDTAIKNIEYFAYGLPVMTSGKVFDFSNEKVVYYQDESKDVDFDLVFSFLLDFLNHANQVTNIAKACSWKNIVSSIMLGTEDRTNGKE